MKDGDLFRIRFRDIGIVHLARYVEVELDDEDGTRTLKGFELFGDNYIYDAAECEVVGEVSVWGPA